MRDNSSYYKLYRKSMVDGNTQVNNNEDTYSELNRLSHVIEKSV